LLERRTAQTNIYKPIGFIQITAPQGSTFLCVFCRSCDRSLRSLDQESPPKKKKLQPAYSSTSHLLTGKKCPSTLQTKSNDLETTVFYIPGVDVKVCSGFLNTTTED
jgi:hypothetical protein